MGGERGLVCGLGSVRDVPLVVWPRTGVCRARPVSGAIRVVVIAQRYRRIGSIRENAVEAAALSGAQGVTD